jgi:hypothetical protein
MWERQYPQNGGKTDVRKAYYYLNNSGALMHGSNFVRSGKIGKIFKN